MTPHPDIVDRALRRIKPRPEQKDACIAVIKKRVELLRETHLSLKAIPSSGKLKEELADIGNALERMQDILSRCSETSRDLVFRGDVPVFLNMLNRAIDSAQRDHDRLVVPRRGRFRWDNVKALTAGLAHELLITFSAKPPTRTEGGAFYRLAS